MEKMKNLIFLARNWKIIQNIKKEFNENGSPGLWEVSNTPMMTSLDLWESPASAGVHCHGSSVRRKLIEFGLYEGPPERSLFWAENMKLLGYALCQLMFTILMITGK